MSERSPEPEPAPLPATGVSGARPGTDLLGALEQRLDGLSGISCMVLAVLFFSAMAACVKLLGTNIPAHEKILIRSVPSALATWWLIRRLGLSPWGKDRRLLLARGLCGLTGMYCYFISLAKLPMGNAVLLTNASPFFAAYFARRWLGERNGRALMWASVLCFFGILAIARPQPHAPLAWSLLALGSSVVNGATYTIVRASARTDHHLVVVLSLPLVAIPITGALCLTEWVSPDARQWWLLLGMTVTSFLGQILMTMGMHRETMGRSTAMFFLGVVLSMVWGQLLGDPALGGLDVLGALLVLAGIITLARGRSVVAPSKA